jgi:hypothetical protein
MAQASTQANAAGSQAASANATNGSPSTSASTPAGASQAPQVSQAPRPTGPGSRKHRTLKWTKERQEALVLAAHESGSIEEIVQKLKGTPPFQAVGDILDKARVGRMLAQMRKAGVQLPKWTRKRVLDVERLNALRGERGEVREG